MLALLVTGTGAVFAEGEQDTVPDEQPVEQEEQPSVYVLMADDKKGSYDRKYWGDRFQQ